MHPKPRRKPSAALRNSVALTVLAAALLLPPAPPADAISPAACRRRPNCRFNVAQWKCICRTRPRPPRITPRRPPPARPEPWKPSPLLEIPPGCYWRGTDAQHHTDRRFRHRVCVSAFQIDERKVTVEDYQHCVDAKRCSIPNVRNSWGRTDRKCNWGAKGQEKHPINCIDWRQARAYCRWLKRRLPTEAEWEYAARGSDGRVLPWGNDREFFCSYAIVQDPRDGRHGCGRHATWPVGSRPAGASPFRVQGIVGNVLEWIADCYNRLFYRRVRGLRVDPAFLRCPHSSPRVVRGASWRTSYRHVSAELRHRLLPNKRTTTVGFRCAK